MINVKNLSFGYPTHKVLEDSSFTIPSGQKVALVGPNGAGKTTLLKILSGLEEPDAGTLQVIGQIGSVPQEVKHDPLLESANSIRDYIDPDRKKRDDQLNRLLTGMELGKLSLNQSPKQLSGGQKTKLAFIRNIILEPDVLILDEPTNFLDIPGKRWVMNFLSKYPKTLLIVSHDVGLLDQAIQKVLFINTHTKQIEEYKGNYSKYQKLKKERDELVKRTRAAQEKRISQMKKGLAKIQGAQSEKAVRQKINLQNRIKRMQDSLPELPPELKNIRTALPEPQNVGRIVLQLMNIGKSFEKNKVLNQVNFILERGEKMALIGRNGAGKSTLLKIIIDQLQPDIGIIETHPQVNLGYYAQEHENFDLDKSLLDTVIDYAPHLLENHARSLLGRFLFSGDRIYQRVGTLSGGEKTRLAIALLTVKGHNLLVLDEPTTYLDVMSQRIILDVLKDYKGAMIVVSHTEEFIKELNPDKALILPENKFDFWRPEMLDRVTEI